VGEKIRKYDRTTPDGEGALALARVKVGELDAVALRREEPS